MWKLTLGNGTGDGFHFVSPLVFGVGPRSLVTQTTHPPKNNETLITTFVLFYAVFFVQKVQGFFVFLSLGEWVFYSCIYFSVFQNYFRHHIFQLHATVYFVPNPLLGQVVVFNTSIFFSANLSHPLRPNCVQSIQREKINKINLTYFPLLMFKNKRWGWTHSLDTSECNVHIHTYICMQFHLQ